METGSGCNVSRQRLALIAHTKNTRITDSWDLGPRSQKKKSDDISQCVAESDILRAGPERPLHEDLKVKPTFQGRSQHVGCVHGPFSEES